MDRQDNMRSVIVASGPRGPATAADIAHDERLEVINGYVVSKDEGEEQVPARGTRHGTGAVPGFERGDVQGTIFGRLLPFRGSGGAGKPGGWWLSQNVEIALTTRETYACDLAGWRIERVAERLRGGPVRIAPDWICAVLSSCTRTRGLGEELKSYHRAGVSHYWIAHPVEHYFHVYRRQEEGYVLMLAASAGDLVRAEPFAGIELDLNDLFALPTRAL
jgi:hypothetical protein